MKQEVAKEKTREESKGGKGKEQKTKREGGGGEVYLFGLFGVRSLE